MVSALVADQTEGTEEAYAAFRSSVARSMFEGLNVEEIAFSEFIPLAWEVIEPQTPFVPNWHIDCIAEHLEAVTLGQITRLIINIPPRNSKSIITTVLWPVHSWISRPWIQFVSASYSGSLAVKHSLDRRRVMESAFFQGRWGNVVQMREDQNKKNEYENTARGHMVATSAQGTATGKGGDIIILDDFINPQQAESEAEREKAHKAFDTTFSSRLNDKKKGAFVVVEQRTHEQDLTGHLLEKGGWVHLSLPAVAPARAVISYPLSKVEMVREPGDILNPKREGPKELEKQKRDSGSRTYEAQWQQNPSSETGNLFKRHWWKFYKENPQDIVQRLTIFIQSWDLAVKDTVDGSFVAGLVMGRVGADIYILDTCHERMDFPATIKAIQNVSNKWPRTTHKLVEDKANGPAAIAQLKKKVPGLIPVPAIGAKEVRMVAATGPVEAGNVFLPDPKRFPWVNDFIEECAHAPAKPNDWPDALSQGIAALLEARIVSEELEEEPMFEAA